MANWCYNSVTVSGPVEDIINMIEPLIDLKSEEFGTCIETFEQLQEQFVKILEDMKIAMYKSKESINYIGCSFWMSTPWGPCTNWYVAMSKKYPRLYFEIAYSEDSCGVFGLLDIFDGRVNTDECFDNEEQLKFNCGENVKEIVKESCEYRLEQMIYDNYPKDEMLEEMMNEFDWYYNQKEVEGLLIDEINRIVELTKQYE